MAYDYSQEFLRRHMEAGTVDQLVDIAKTGGFAKLSYPTPQELRSAQYEIRNILASVEFHMPENKTIRTVIRTWVEYDKGTEQWNLFIGIPTKRIGGQRGGIRTLTPLGLPVGNNVMPREEEPNQIFPKLVENQSAWIALGAYINSRLPHVETVRAEFGQAIADPARIDVFEGWKLDQVGPTTIIYRRNRPNDNI